MRKIFDWFFGSFFRTLGRVIGFLVLSFLLVSILNNLDIDLPLLNNYVVHARTSDITLQEVYVVRNNDPTYTNGSMSIQPNTCNAIDNYFTEPWVRGSGYSSQMQLTTGSFSGSADLYLIYSTESNNVFYNRTTPDLFVYASNSAFGSNNNALSLTSTSNYSKSYDYFYLPSSISRGTQYVIHVTFDYEGTVNTAGNFYVNVGFKYRDGYNNLFSQIETTTPNNDTSFCFTSPYPYNSYTDNNYNSTFTFINTDNSTSTIINQNEIIIDNGQQTINSINNLNDNIMDDELDDSEIEEKLDFGSESSSFGPFSTFLTLPLTWVQNILASNQTCQTLSLPLPYINQNLTLPCMTDFWNSLGALGVLIQACWLAVVGVRIFNGLFVLVVETTSAKDNYDELTKIKSWEL